MTVQNLNKILDRYESQLGIANSANKHFEILKGLPFYIWSPIRYSETDTSDMMSDYEDPVTCMAFNHAVGLPQKNGRSMPLFDYERLLFDTLQNHKHIWTKKATGLDVRVCAQVYG